MKKDIITILLLGFTLSSCNNKITNNTQTDLPVKSISTNNIVEKNTQTGIVSLNYNPQVKGFGIKGVNFSNPLITKLKLEATGLGFNSVSQTVDFNPQQPVNFKLSVPTGKNRVLSLSGLDADGNILSTLYGDVNVLINQENIGKISFFETLVGQVLTNIIHGTNQAMINNLNSDNLRNYLINLTGFDEVNNKFTGINPLLVDSVSIANYISSNNGELPPVNFANTTGTGTVNVNSEQTDLTIMINDLNSSVAQNTTTNSTIVQNISPGMWQLTVTRPGSEAVKVNVKVTSGQTTDINIPDLASRTVHITSGDAATLEKIAGDTAYINYHIDLAPGTYQLSKGLELQKGQKLIGHQQYMDRDVDGVWDPINVSTDPADATANYVRSGLTLLDMSQTTFPYNAFGIVLRSGNSIEGVTVKGAGPIAEAANNRKMVICTGQPDNITDSSEPCSITNTVVTDTYVGIGAVYYSIDPSSPVGSVASQNNTVNIQGNVVYRTGGDAALAATGPFGMTATVFFKKNRFTGSYAIPNSGGGHGLLVNNYATTGNTLNINTEGNIMDKNGDAGVLMMSGLTFFGNPAIGNKINWNSLNDKITRNGAGGGGIDLLSLVELNDPSTSHDNSLSVNLVGTNFKHISGVQNMGTDTDPSGNVIATYPRDIRQLGPAILIPGSGSGVINNTNTLSAHGVKSNTRQTHKSTYISYVGYPDNSVTILPDTAEAFNIANPDFLWRINKNPDAPDFNQ